MEEKEYTQEYVKHVFSEDETREIATSLALKVSEMKAAEDEKKAVTSDFNSQIDSAKSLINLAATKLNNGYEMRTVKCEIVRDYSLRMILYYRVDTGDLAKERPMTTDDLQMKID